MNDIRAIKECYVYANQNQDPESLDYLDQCIQAIKKNDLGKTQIAERVYNLKEILDEKFEEHFFTEKLLSVPFNRISKEDIRKQQTN